MSAHYSLSAGTCRCLVRLSTRYVQAWCNIPSRISRRIRLWIRTSSNNRRNIRSGDLIAGFFFFFFLNHIFPLQWARLCCPHPVHAAVHPVLSMFASGCYFICLPRLAAKDPPARVGDISPLERRCARNSNWSHVMGLDLYIHMAGVSFGDTFLTFYPHRFDPFAEVSLDTKILSEVD